MPAKDQASALSTRLSWIARQAPGSGSICSDPRRRRSCRSQPWPCAPVRPNSTSMTRWRCIRQWQTNLFCYGHQGGNSRSTASDTTAGAPEDTAKAHGEGSRGAFAKRKELVEGKECETLLERG